ncbi:MAG: nitrate ABC transporter substrate-binding protein [Betaproteobacteria bacterium RIFCSPLOWO2_02_FULL_62_17]|nr:MAG: nitrate ABC transporter substrate-binding protein [Betaproteobacteria bacterium RIFCSPLOWO2_02_FULL_62_17]
MQTLLRAAALGAVLIAAAGDANAVNYLQAPALAAVVKTGVTACTGKEALQLPIITWGGDIATVFANGNQADTGRGSLFDKAGLKLRLAREDVLAKQLDAYLACRTPFLRGTLGMLGQVAEVTERDPRTRMVIVHQLTWSAGGDALVVKGGINQPADLRGKSIALQAYGPHIDYLARVLRDAGLSLKDVRLRWVRDLTGSNQSPRAALQEAGIDAAMLIIPDALALTSGGKVGTGAEESVRGAKILLSTKTANRVIADVYAVRADYLAANRASVEKLVRAMLIANEQLAALFKRRSSNDPAYRAMIQGAARLLLDSPEAVPDTEAMYGDAVFAGLAGNIALFNDARNPRSLAILGREVDEALIGAGLRNKPVEYAHAKWDFNALKGDLKSAAAAESPRFDTPAVTQVATRRTQQGAVAEGQLFTFAVQFKPNQDAFTTAQYQKDFDRAVNLAATYGGAVITVEGHADPLAFLQRKKGGEAEVVLGRIRQAAKNLSFTRANAVREGIIKYGKERGVVLDASQFVVVGHGIEKPKSGVCAGDPCAPKSEAEWLANMRVEFRIIQVEAEANVFRPQ